MNVPPVQLPSNRDGDGSSLTISDVLPKTRSINIFSSLTRDVERVTSRLTSSDPAVNTTVLAPLNSAMQALPRKPWEDRPGQQAHSDAALAGGDEGRAAENLARFVESHVVPVSPWVEGKAGKVKSLGGGELWWEERDGGKQRVIMPGEIEVHDVVGKVGNGEVWTLKGICNYA